MNTKTTWRLLALCVVLLAYILVFERPSSDSAKKVEEVAKLFPGFDPAKATAIGIGRTNFYIGVERVNDRWQMTKPIYPAQSTAVEEFLRSIAGLQKHAEIPAHVIATQPGGRAAFGLQPPKASVTIQSGTNRINFGIGSRTLMADQLYLQITGDSKVLVTDAQILERLPASAQEWRNAMLVHEEKLLFDQLVVTNETGWFEIVRDTTNQLWKLAWPVGARANGNAIDYLIQQLRSARVSQFVTDDPAADLEPFGLQTPKAHLTLARGTNAVLQLQFGQSPTNNPALIYARRPSQTNVVLVNRDLVDLLRKPHEFFRDRTLLYFSEPAVSRIEVKATKEAFALQRANSGEWLIVEPFNAPADPEVVHEFFANLARLSIIDFEKDVVTDFSVYGFSPSDRRYVLKSAATNTVGATGPVLAQVEFGTNHVDKIFARRADQNSVYTVSLGEVLRLPQFAFELRDRRIWNFASSNVVSLTVSQRGRTRKLERNAQHAWSAEIVENAELEELLHRLGELRAASWRAKGEEQMRLRRFPEIDYQITLDVNTSGKIQPYAIRFGPLSSEGPFAAVLLEEGQWVIFLFPGTLFQDVVRLLSIP